MLTTLLVLIALVLVAMIATRFISTDKGPNRYRAKPKSKQKQEPTFSEQYHEQDADEVLGLKSCDNQTQSLHCQTVEKPKEPRVIALNLVAPTNKEFGGYDLLQAILAQGLRFGDMKIFHRHEHRSGRGEVLFSMASVAEPGTFDLATMSEYHTRGLTFFLCYDRVTDPKQALDVMVGVISNLRDELGGDIFDKQGQEVNKYSLADLYQEIDVFLDQQIESERTL